MDTIGWCLPYKLASLVSSSVNSSDSTPGSCATTWDFGDDDGTCLTAYMPNLTSSELAHLVEENLSAKSMDFAMLLGGEAHTGNPAWFRTGINRAGYNGVVCAAFEKETLDEQIETALEPFRQRDLPLTWWGRLAVGGAYIAPLWDEVRSDNTIIKYYSGVYPEIIEGPDRWWR